ncbi:biotin transporter BioY, partial [Arthrobacter globiformis]|uniref:biotin transporter BioY n=1 Tax=Arthrobacter globiformis TaxID=1665 RepID=UPI001124E796
VKFRAALLFAAAMVTSIVLIHGLGIVGMMVNAKLDFAKAFLADLPFYPGDILKNVLAVAVAIALHKAFPDLLVRRVRPLPQTPVTRTSAAPKAETPEASTQQ